MKKTAAGIERNKKLRYGSTSVILTVSFVALVIIVNVIFTAFADKYRWYIDMTSESLYSLDDSTVEALKDVKDEVLITFCQDRDEVDADSALYLIHNTAKNLADKFDNIKIEYRDVLRDKKYLERFRTVATDYVKTTSVIISSGTEYRKHDSINFYVQDTEDPNDIWAYNGENRFASSILMVTASEMPVAYFTKGHGEALTGDAETFISLIEDAGYKVEAIDLSTEEISEDARLLIINDPQYDFGGIYDEHVGKSEIEKIDEFLDGYGSLFTFVSPERVGGLTNLTEFLEEWGVVFMPGVTVSDPENAVSVDGFSVVGQYNTDETELGKSVYSRLLQLSSQPKAIFRSAAPIKHAWNEEYVSTNDMSSRVISDVFSTSPTAKLTENGEVRDAEERYALMTISQDYKIVDNEDYTSYVVASACPDFISPQYLNSNVHSNRDVIHSLLISLGKEHVPASIDFKVFADYDLDITTAEANSWTRVLVLVMPILTAAACIFVTVRRRYR